MISTHPAQINSNRIDERRRLDPTVRHQHLQVRAWALARGTPIERDALTVVLATVLETQRVDGTDPFSWSTERVTEFVWGTCFLWCVDQGVVVPRATPDALAHWWAFLNETEAFTSDSDDLPTLLRTLRTHCAQPRRRSATASRQHIGPS